MGLTAGPQYPPCELLPSTLGRGVKGVEIDAGDGVDGVDRAQAVRAGAPGRARDDADVGDVGRQLHQHRRARRLLHPLGDMLRVLRHLADGRAHAALAHAMGQPKFSSSPSAPAPSARFTISCQASRFDSTISDAMTACFG